MIISRSGLCAVIAVAAACGIAVRSRPAAAQTDAKPPMTLEWVFSAEGRRLAALPRTAWLSDGTLMSGDGSATTLNGTLSWLYWEEVFGRRDIGYWWSPDSRRIAYLRTDESKVDLETFVDFRPLTPRVITQRYPKAGRPNPEIRVGIV